MRCVEPFVKAGEVYPCGRCLPCKFRIRRIWFHRILLEASQHDYSSVVTLTYDQAALPADEQLHPEHLRDWLKRYRKRALERYPWRYLRFYACGEYGENEGRPHYHVVLFGQPGCEFGRNGRVWCGDCGCVTCQDITESWTFGTTSVDRLSKESAAYVAGYVTRKLSASMMGKTILPFTRMSRNPGLGANAMHDVASVVLQYGLELPRALRHGSQTLTLGRYLRGKLSECTSSEIQPFVATSAMQAVRDYAWRVGRSHQSVYREVFEAYASQLAQREALREKVL